jgi:hypothetical protein
MDKDTNATSSSLEAAKSTADKVIGMMPENTSTGEIIMVLGTIITTYSKTEEDAAKIFSVLATELARYYGEMKSGDCECPRCTEVRRAAAEAEAKEGQKH